jgi:hypothetical protein
MKEDIMSCHEFPMTRFARLSFVFDAVLGKRLEKDPLVDSKSCFPELYHCFVCFIPDFLLQRQKKCDSAVILSCIKECLF